MDGIHAFEEGDNRTAVRILTPLFEAWATIPHAYLKHIKSEKLAEVDEQLIQSRENCIPDGLRLQSQQYLKASSAYIAYMKTLDKRLSTGKRKRALKSLETLVQNSNPRAVVLLNQLEEEGKINGPEQVRHFDYQKCLDTVEAAHIDLDLVLLIRKRFNRDGKNLPEYLKKFFIVYDAYNPQPSEVKERSLEVDRISYLCVNLGNTFDNLNKYTDKIWSLMFNFFFLQNYRGGGNFSNKLEIDLSSINCDLEIKRYIYWHACVHNHASPKTLLNYAMMLDFAEGGNEDLKGARECYEQAAYQGDIEHNIVMQ